MRTRDRDMETRIAQLERAFWLESSSGKQSSFALKHLSRTSKNSNKPRASSIICGILAGGIVLSMGWENMNKYLPSNTGPLWIASSGYQYGIDPHTIEGTAKIHQIMQAGKVKVKKSTITGIIDQQTMTASMYWTFILKNHNTSDKEATITMELPKNAVLSRATLWINGVPQEAAFSSNKQVQNAYDSIVVRHRDPLLVTQAGPNKIKILAAPVTANGGEMQFRIGITIPAQTDETGRNFVRLPQILESNLEFDSKQDIHLTADKKMGGLGTTEHSGIYTLRANIASNEMKNAKIDIGRTHQTKFATRLTHTSPPEYLKASIVDGEMELVRTEEKPDCKLINNEDAAFRLSNLWAHQEIEKLALQGKGNDACNLANVYRIVSSVSGATVLEEDYDYQGNGLNRDMYRTIGRPSSSGDDFSTVKGFVPYHENQGWSSAPMLQGATNGTIGPQGGDAFAPRLQGGTIGSIGPQGQDATVIMGVNTSGTVRVNNLANLECLFNLFGFIAQIIGVALASFMLAEAAFNNGLRAPVRLSRAKTLFLALAIGAAGVFTPTAISTVIAWVLDANLLS